MVPSWAPQAQVLAHDSTGGFVTHCGWKSTLESIVHCLPLIAWTLYAEQKMTAVMLTDDLKVAFRPQANENGLVGRGDRKGCEMFIRWRRREKSSLQNEYLTRCFREGVEQRWVFNKITI